MSGYSVIADYGASLLVNNPAVPGTPNVRVYGGLRAGSVATCLLHVAARWHAEVEPLVQGLGIWGYERRTIAGSGYWSNHASGSAVDLNAALHPSHVDGTLTPTQLQRISSIESEVSSAINWGGRWDPGSLDAMHWQVRDGAAGHLVDELAARLLRRPTPGPPRPTGRPAYPFVHGDGRYFGPYSGPAESISGSGINDARYRPALALWQAEGLRRGFGPTVADGFYGPATAAAAERLQRASHIAVDGLIGWDTWNAMWP